MVEVAATTITQDRLPAGGRLLTVSATVGVLGLIATGIGYAVDSGQHTIILAGYLVAFAYWLGIAVAASIWNAIFHASAARWMTVFRRILESMAAATPIFILLFLPIALGMTTLFPWVSPSNKMSAEQLHLLDHKAAWLNTPGFLAGGDLLLIWVG
jgi:hypothetical protein